MDRGAWWATVHGVTESHLFICCPLVVELLVFLFCLKKAIAYSTEPGINLDWYSLRSSVGTAHSWDQC